MRSQLEGMGTGGRATPIGAIESIERGPLTEELLFGRTCLIHANVNVAEEVLGKALKK